MTSRGEQADAADVRSPGRRGPVPDPSELSEAGDDAPRVRAAKVATRLAKTRRRLEHTTAGHVARRALEVDVVHQALVFAALAFLLLVPILISVSALVPLGADGGVAAGFAHRFGLTDEATRDLQDLFPARAAVRGNTTWGGVLLSAICAFSWPLTLQKGYESVWALPRAGVRELWRPVTWLLAVVLLLVVTAMLHAVSSGAGPVVVLVIGVPALFAWSWWTQHFLLCGRVAWLHLWPGALATALGLTALAVLASLLLSASIVVHHDQYGPIGVVFMMLSWLIALSVVMLGGALLGAFLVERWRARRDRSDAPQTPTPAREVTS